jgi:peptidoglycan/LPS O-acetylase OafA/YrhL
MERQDRSSGKLIKLDYLEGLRGYAALAVALLHFIRLVLPALSDGKVPDIGFGHWEMMLRHSPLNILWNGGAAVAVFFVLSGFVLSYKFWQVGDLRAVVGSAIRRYFRLTPVVLASVLLAYVCLASGVYYLHAASRICGSDIASGYGNRYAFNPDFWDALRQGLFGALLQNQNYYNSPLWTLYYEFLGSMLVFGFLVVCGKMAWRLPAYALLLWQFGLGYFGAFILGVALCDAFVNWPDRPKGKALLAVLFTGAFLALSYGGPGNYADPLHRWLHATTGLKNYWLSIHVAGAALLLYVLMSSPMLQRAFQTPFAARLGRLSYAIYAIHWIVMSSISSVLVIWLKPWMPYWTMALLVIGISLLATILYAEALYKWVDAPGVRLSKLISGFIMGESRNRNKKLDPIDSLPSVDKLPAEITN